MPHNLYLHSALVQTRTIGHDEKSKRAACRFNLIDSVVALNGAMFVNCAILVLAAAVFFKHGIVVTEIQQAQQLLVPLLSSHPRGGDFRHRAALLRAIFHAHRNPCGSDHYGRFPQPSHEALAAAPDHPLASPLFRRP